MKKYWRDFRKTSDQRERLDRAKIRDERVEL
jgi:hypothetical protein